MDGYFPGHRFRASASQMTIGSTRESAANYRRMDNASFMSNFGIEVTHRLSSDVPAVTWMVLDKKHFLQAA